MRKEIFIKKDYRIDYDEFINICCKLSKAKGYEDTVEENMRSYFKIRNYNKLDINGCTYDSLEDFIDCINCDAYDMRFFSNSNKIIMKVVEKIYNRACKFAPIKKDIVVTPITPDGNDTFSSDIVDVSTTYSVDDEIEFMDGTKKAVGVVLDKTEHKQAFSVDINANEYEVIEVAKEVIHVVGHQRMKLLNKKEVVEAPTNFSEDIVITKDNIHLYCEFMSDEDLQNYSHILNIVLFDRFKTIRDTLKLDIPALVKDSLFNSVLDDTFNNRVNVSFFNVKDTLKPIDEYIEDIKGSSEYKKYSFKLFSSDSVIVDENGQMVETGIVYAAETVRMATDGSGDKELHLNPGEKLISCTSLDESQQEDLIEELKAQLF